MEPSFLPGEIAVHTPVSRMPTSYSPRSLRRSDDVPSHPAHRILALLTPLCALGALLSVPTPARAQLTVTGDTTLNYGGSPTNHVGTIYVGNWEAGTAILEGGATRNIEGGFILGYGPDASGTMTITGANTVWTFAGTRRTAYIGFNGAGALNITDSGRMNFAGGLSIGVNTTTPTTSATLTIASGGVLATTTGITSTGIGIGVFNGTNSASISVDGAGSLLSVFGGIQMDANTSLTVTGGAQATFTKNITLRGDSGTATTTSIRVSGTGSLVSSTGTLDAGLGSSGIGNLTVTDGGKLRIGGDFTMRRGTIKVGDGAAPGYLDTAIIDGIDTGGPALEFNHTSDNYSFVNDAGTGIVLRYYMGVKILAGTTVFTANSGYFNGTTITGGTLIVLNDPGSTTASGIGSGPITIGSAGTLIVGNGGSLGTLSGTSVIINNGHLTLNTSRETSLQRSISGSGTFTKQGSGELSLNAYNTDFTGTLTISGGLLSIYNINAFGSGSTSLASGTALKFNVSGLIGGNVTLSGTGTDGTGVLIGAAATPVFTGTLTLAGDTTVNVGWNGNLTLAGVIGESATASRFTKIGLGTLTLANTNTYTGGMTISAGSVIAKYSGAFGAGTGGVTVSAGTALLLQGDATLTGHTLTLNGYGYGGNTGALRNVSGSNTWAGNVTLAADSYLSTAAGSVLTITGGLNGGNLELTKNDTGTLVLGGAGTFLGKLTVNAGTLTLAHSLALQSATLNINDSTLSFGTLTAAALGGLTGSAPVSLTNASGDGVTLTINSAVNSGYGSVLSGAGSLVKTGAATFSLSGNNTFTGPTLVSAGTLQLGTPLALQYSRIEVAQAGTLTFGGPDATIGGLSGTGNVSLGVASSIGLTVNTTASSSFGGVLSGLGSLTKAGAGVLTLAGANTYTGATAVTNGTLRVNGSLAATPVTVSAGATLAGTGRIGGLTTIQAGATLAGSLTFTAGLVLKDEAILSFSLGSASDLLRVSGGELDTVSGHVVINLTDAGDFVAGTYTLVDFTGAIFDDLDASAFTLGPDINIDGYTFSLALDGKTLVLTATSAVPEPAATAAIFGVIALICSTRRRTKESRLTTTSVGAGCLT